MIIDGAKNKSNLIVLELCYEVALGDFDMAQSELEELSRRITSQVRGTFISSTWSIESELIDSL